MFFHLIRIQIYSANADVYIAAGRMLKEIGMTNEIRLSDGIVYYLPQGEFFYSGDESTQVVHDIVKSVLFELDSQHSVVVITADSETKIYTSGLRPVHGMSLNSYTIH